MSINGWMDKKIQYIHTMEYYSARKRNRLLIHEFIWMNLQCIMLCERSQFQLATYFNSIQWHSGKGKTIGTENRSVMARGWVWAKGWTQKDLRNFKEMIEFFCVMIMVVVTQMYILVKTHRIATQWIKFIIHKL